MNVTNIKKISLTAIFIAVSSFASAGVTQGTYVGLSVGGANQFMNFNQGSFNQNTSGNDVIGQQWSGVGRVFSGYNFGRYAALEGGFAYTTSADFNYPNGLGDFNMNASTLDVSFLPMLPVSNSPITVFGRLGVTYNWLTTNSDNCNCDGKSLSAPYSANFADELGAGVRYKINANFSTRLEWLANGLIFPVGLNSGNTQVGKWSEQTFQIGGAYHF